MLCDKCCWIRNIKAILTASQLAGICLAPMALIEKSFFAWILHVYVSGKKVKTFFNNNRKDQNNITVWPNFALNSNGFTTHGFCSDYSKGLKIVSHSIPFSSLSTGEKCDSSPTTITSPTSINLVAAQRKTLR